MSERVFHVGIFGTFDVQNYGDLLFPIIAEAELGKRLGAVKLHRFSYHARTPPAWPYEVTSVTAFPELASSLDCVLIGGGFIVRFDKEVAPNYRPPATDIHHPTGYWLIPALIALQYGVPLAWNAPGMHCNDIPAWAEPMMKLAFRNSQHIRVRDEPSRLALAAFVDEARIGVLPDTGFGISRFVDQANCSAAFAALKASVPELAEPYIVVQATYGIDSFLHMVRSHPQRFEAYRFLILPIGPVLHDRESNIGDLPGAIHLSFWPEPLLLAEVLGRAQAVVGHSYHLAITALACGVPAFCSADLSVGKYTALANFEDIFAIVKDREIDPQWFVSRLGKKQPSRRAQDALERLDEHWDQVAEIAQQGRAPTQVPLNRFWQDLPNLLETVADRSLEKVGELSTALADAQARAAAEALLHARDVAQLEATLASTRIQAAQEALMLRQHAEHMERLRLQAESAMAALHASHSMRLTAPLRRTRRLLAGIFGSKET